MPRLIAVSAQKGGVGKTTTVVNVAAALAERGLRVLVCDLDPQADATLTFGVDKRRTEFSVVPLLSERPARASDLLVPSNTAGVDLLAGHVDLARAEVTLHQMIGRETVLRDNLLPELEGLGYDLVLIDTPPSVGLLTLNALTLAEELVLPVQCQYYAWEGLDRLIELVLIAAKRLRHRVRLTGVLLTMFDRRTRLSHQTASELHDLFGPWVFANLITVNTRLAEAPAHGRTALVHDPEGAGTKAYRAVAEEILARTPPWSPLTPSVGLGNPAPVPIPPPEEPSAERRRDAGTPPLMHADLERLRPLVLELLGLDAEQGETAPPAALAPPEPRGEARRGRGEVTTEEEEALWGDS